MAALAEKLGIGPAHLWFKAFAVAACLAISGCGLTNKELEQTTDPLADSIPRMLNAQIAHNLLLKDKNQYAIPGQVVIAGGNSQVSNQLILPSAGLTSIGRFFTTFELQNQNQWQQGWSVTAVTDVGDLQRLDALYRYAWRYIGLCEFVNEYTDAPIMSSSTPILRVSDFDNVNAQRQDFNYKNPPGFRLQSGTSPKTEFGPPADLPLPPREVVDFCRLRPKGDPIGVVPAPDDWPTPFPQSSDFVWIDGSRYPHSEHPTAELDDVHELHGVYVDGKNFARFQFWVLGATVNTSSSGKSGNSSPSKAISGAGG